MPYITASRLYDFLQCPHRVWRDIYGPLEEKSEETNPFVRLLWDRGVNHEDAILAKLGDFLNLEEGSIDERFGETMEAMKSKEPLIYQGVLKYDNLLGIPDILKRSPDGVYIPIDIKSGAGFDGIDEKEGGAGKPKKHYAVQLCLYGDILKKLGFADSIRGGIIDIRGSEIEYDLLSPMGGRTTETWLDYYEKTKEQVESLVNDREKTLPAVCGVCKLCPWHDSCEKWCKESKDLTTVFCLGRSFRDKINQDLLIGGIDDFLNIDVGETMKLKEATKLSGDPFFLRGIGESSLQKSINRAKILYQTKKPVIYRPIYFPKTRYELFFDIEDDPTREFVYLHGVYERNGAKERFRDFCAKEFSAAAEKNAWRDFWEYVKSLPQNDFSVYYYSAHEETTYKRLQKRYSDVITAEELENFFNNPNVIDLYGIIQKQTDWPSGSYSLKALASYSGFHWRDETPSGSLSIQWFNDYLETKNESTLKRILEYNEDDCKATMALKDKLEKMSGKMFPKSSLWRGCYPATRSDRGKPSSAVARPLLSQQWYCHCWLFLVLMLLFFQNYN